MPTTDVPVRNRIEFSLAWLLERVATICVGRSGPMLRTTSMRASSSCLEVGLQRKKGYSFISNRQRRGKEARNVPRGEVGLHAI